MVLLGLVGGNAILAWLHFAETDHSPRYDLISAYAHSRFPRIYALHNFTFVIAGAGAAIGTHRFLPNQPFLSSLCLVYSLGVAILAIFPMDMSAMVKTFTGVMHVVGVVMVFAAATIYSAVLSHFGSVKVGSGIKYSFDFITFYMVIGVAILLVAQFRKFRTIGLIERIAAAGLSLWLIGILIAAR